MPIDIADPPARPAVLVVLTDELREEPPSSQARHATDAQPPVPEAQGLPLGRLAGLAGSGVFAFWTSLTCFVC